eukprot:3548121-Prymnesium_polylepis.1
MPSHARTQNHAAATAFPCGRQVRGPAHPHRSSRPLQLLTATHEELDEQSSLTVSRVSSCLMLVVYGCYLVFQLVTHTDLFEGEEGEVDDDERILGASGAVFWLAVITFFIAILSEYMVDAIRGAAAECAHCTHAR